MPTHKQKVESFCKEHDLVLEHTPISRRYRDLYGANAVQIDVSPRHAHAFRDNGTVRHSLLEWTWLSMYERLQSLCTINKVMTLVLTENDCEECKCT